MLNLAYPANDREKDQNEIFLSGGTPLEKTGVLIHLILSCNRPSSLPMTEIHRKNAPARKLCMGQTPEAHF
jgi:hypothetical protein